MSATDRLLTFELCDAIYALPIAGVLEVAEAARVTCVPTLPRDRGGVMNWHGDALPVLLPHLLLREEAPADADAATREHVLVVSDQGDEKAQLGLPVDRIVGLVDGAARASRSGELVVERRPVDGRVVNVLDPRQLVARAQDVIEGAAA